MTSNAQRLTEALHARWAWRTWYRTTCRDLFGRRWDDLALANAREIRLLVRQLRRSGR